MRQNLLWLLALLAVAALANSKQKRADPHICFVVQRFDANRKLVELTVDGRYDPPYLMARTDSRYKVKKIRKEDYLQLLDLGPGEHFFAYPAIQEITGAARPYNLRAQTVQTKLSCSLKLRPG